MDSHASTYSAYQNVNQESFSTAPVIVNSHVSPNPGPSTPLYNFITAVDNVFDSDNDLTDNIPKRRGNRLRPTHREALCNTPTYSDFEDYLPDDDAEYFPPQIDKCQDSTCNWLFEMGANEKSTHMMNKNKIISPSCSENDGSDSEVFEMITSKCTSTNTTDKTSSSNSVTVSTTNNSVGKRVWDRKAACIYCSKVFSKLSKHLESRHSNEIDVAKYLIMPKKSKQRRKELLRLRNLGNYHYNKDVIMKQEGAIIPSKRPMQSSSADQYYPCENCLGFFKRVDLWRHAKTCVSKLETNTTGRTRRQKFSEMLIPLPESCSKGLLDNVIPSMHEDSISLAVKNDKLILSFGSKLYQKVGHDQHTYTYISQKMRELGRFLLTARSLDRNVNCLADCISAQKFNLNTSAVKELCGYDEKEHKFSNPSLSLKLGYSLKNCAGILKGQAIVAKDEELQKQVENFVTLHTMNWTTEVSTTALTNLERGRWNKLQVIPVAEDIQKLQLHLSSELQKWITELKDKKDKLSWSQLSEATLANIIFFNRRRGGEAQRLKISSYTERDVMPCQTEVLQSLSDFEKNLAKTLTLLEVRGKRGRKVPVLLKTDVKNAVELLIEYRTTAGINPENVYIFARCNFQSLNPIRGTDVMRRYAKECRAEHPELITSTKLRKHVATMCQIINLKENELDTLATFMGHDLAVHRNYYRLPESTVMLAKISKVLLAAETGKMNKYQGKCLNDIEITSFSSDDGEQSSSCSDGEERTGTEVTKRKKNTSQLRTLGLPESSSDCETRNCKKMHKASNKKRKAIKQKKEAVKKSTSGFNKQADEDDDIENVSNSCPVPNKQRKVCQRTPWTTEEKQAVLTNLSKFIRLKKVPGKKDCEMCISQSNGILANRSWKQVKFTIYNEIQKLKP